MIFLGKTVKRDVSCACEIYVDTMICERRKEREGRKKKERERKEGKERKEKRKGEKVQNSSYTLELPGEL